MAVSKNARLFLERTGFRPTLRRPIATIVPGDNLVHSYPLDRPLPRPESVRDGFPAPDRASTENDPWHLGPES
jgi:hypothetical protein